MLQYYEDLIANEHVVPSQATLYRHRLTIHMAYCLVAQRRAADMMATGGIVVWGTMDSSPQGGHNWLMCGFSAMRCVDLPDSLRKAHRLWHLRDSNDPQELAEVSEAMSVLSRRLELIPSCPTAVAKRILSTPSTCFGHFLKHSLSMQLGLFVSWSPFWQSFTNSDSFGSGPKHVLGLRVFSRLAPGEVP